MLQQHRSWSQSVRVSIKGTAGIAESITNGRRTHTLFHATQFRDDKATEESGFLLEEFFRASSADPETVSTRHLPTTRFSALLLTDDKSCTRRGAEPTGI